VSNAKTAVGTQVKRGDGGSPETFTKIAEVKSVKGPSQDVNVIDVSNFDSPNGYEEYAVGLKKGGVLQCSVNLIPQDSVYKLLLADFESRRIGNYQVILPDASSTTGSFTAFVAKLDRTLDVKQVMEVAIDLQITGAITWAP
jgi:predicted secreted protein